MKRALALFLALVMAITAFGCKKKDNEQSTGAQASTNVPGHEGEVRSNLTGEWIKKEINDKRPLACMLSNQPEAPAPSGIGDAKIIYEAPAEGDYATRMMGIFEDWEGLKKIGSVRSCRTYYLYFMLEFDCIYVHAGQAMPALYLVEKDFVDNISSTESNSKAFYTVDNGLSKEHTLFAKGEGILECAKDRKYRLTHNSDYTNKLKFNEDDNNKVTPEGGETANLVKVGYPINKPYFEYNSSDGKYYRYQTRKGTVEKVCDNETKKQVAVDNVIVQYCSFSKYSWDDQLTQYWNINCTSGGKGKFITNGKAIDITWKKDSEFGVTRYYDSKGKEITLNQGKTWICIVKDTEKESVEVLSDKETQSSSSASKNTKKSN